MPRDWRRNAFGCSASNMLRTKSASAMSSTRANPSASNCVADRRTQASCSGDVAVPQIAYVRMAQLYRGGRTDSSCRQRKRSRSRGITSSAALPSPRTSTPRTIAAGTPSRLAHHELGGAGELVRDRDLRRAELAPACVGRTAKVAERRDPGDAERDVGRALPPRAPERVAHDHADVRPRQLDEPFAQPPRGRVGVEREQDEQVLARRVRGVDAGRGADEAVARLGDHERRP